MYNFPLESLLKHIKFKEENIQKELGVLKKQLSVDMENLVEFQNKKKRTKKELVEKQKKGITISMNLLYHNFVERLSGKIVEQNKVVENAEKKVDQKRELLMNVLKKRKGIDILKEKGLQGYMSDLLQKEQKFIDEVAINSFYRKKLTKNQ